MRFNSYKRFVPADWKIGYRLACWARNHSGWAKMKKAYRRTAKRRLERAARKDMEE